MTLLFPQRQGWTPITEPKKHYNHVRFCNKKLLFRRDPLGTFPSIRNTRHLVPNSSFGSSPPLPNRPPFLFRPFLAARDCGTGVLFHGTPAVRSRFQFRRSRSENSAPALPHTYTASASFSPVLIRTTVSTGVMKIFPSPMVPVRAAAITFSIT